MMDARARFRAPEPHPQAGLYNCSIKEQQQTNTLLRRPPFPIDAVLRAHSIVEADRGEHARITERCNEGEKALEKCRDGCRRVEELRYLGRSEQLVLRLAGRRRGATVGCGKHTGTAACRLTTVRQCGHRNGMRALPAGSCPLLASGLQSASASEPDLHARIRQGGTW